MRWRVRQWGLRAVCLGVLAVSAHSAGYAQDELPAAPEQGAAPAVSEAVSPSPTVAPAAAPAVPESAVSPVVAPPAAAGAPPADVANTPAGDVAAAAEPPKEEEKVWINIEDGDIRDIVKQISKATGRNFILDDKLRGRKLTILSERPLTKGEAYQMFVSALNVAGFTIVEGVGGVYKVVNLQEAKRNPIPTHVDTTPISDSFVTRLVTLDNVGAAAMMTAIRDMLSQGGSISVYPPTNTLILTDAGTNIDRLMKIMKELDQEGPQQVMEIIPIKNAAAKDVAAMINQLFEQQKQGQGAIKPGEPVDIEEVSKLIPDDRTNSLIVLASKRAMDQVRGIIAKLDQKLASGQEGRIHVYYLKFAKAKDLASTLSALTAEAGKQPAGGAAGAPKALAEFEGGVKITADESINALVITASAKDYQNLIDRVIAKLDVQRRQVYLEAVIMELRVSSTRNLGVSAHGGAGGGALGFGQTFGAIQSLQGSLLQGAAGPALLGGLISQSTVNINVLGPTGTTSTVSIPAFSAFLNALSTAGDVNIVSTPNLLTLDNEEASIEVQEEQPIPGPQAVGTSGIATITPVTYERAGLVMKIKPQIGHGDMLNLKIEQELSTFGVPKDASLKAPAKIKRKVTTNVLSRDGQTIVIGGMMQDETDSSKRKIPLLGDIPLLGFFFSQHEKKANKSNLLIFITPHIVKDSTDFSDIVKRKIEERNRFIESNYGARQKEVIRSSIRSHREDLLEFKEEGGDEEPIRPYTPPLMTLPPARPLPPPQATVRPMPAAVAPPVISVPPAPSVQKSGAPVITGPSGPILQSDIPPSPPAEVQSPVWLPSKQSSSASKDRGAKDEGRGTTKSSAGSAEVPPEKEAVMAVPPIPSDTVIAPGQRKLKGKY